MGNNVSSPCKDGSGPTAIRGVPFGPYFGRCTTSTTVYMDRTTTNMDQTEKSDEDLWTTGTAWITETTREPAYDQISTTTLTSHTATTVTSTLPPITDTASEPSKDQTSTITVTSPTTTTTTTTLTPATETVSGPTIEQTWTTIVTSVGSTTATETLTPMITTSEVVLSPSNLVGNEIGSSPGHFDFGLIAFIIVVILCGLGVIAFIVWLLAELLRSRRTLARRAVPVDVNNQARDDSGPGRDTS